MLHCVLPETLLSIFIHSIVAVEASVIVVVLHMMAIVRLGLKSKDQWFRRRAALT